MDPNYKICLGSATRTRISKQCSVSKLLSMRIYTHFILVFKHDFNEKHRLFIRIIRIVFNELFLQILASGSGLRPWLKYGKKKKKFTKRDFELSFSHFLYWIGLINLIKSREAKIGDLLTSRGETRAGNNNGGFEVQLLFNPEKDAACLNHFIAGIDIARADALSRYLLIQQVLIETIHLRIEET